MDLETLCTSRIVTVLLFLFCFLSFLEFDMTMNCNWFLGELFLAQDSVIMTCLRLKVIVTRTFGVLKEQAWPLRQLTWIRRFLEVQCWFCVVRLECQRNTSQTLHTLIWNVLLHCYLFFLRMWLEIHPPGSDGGILYVCMYYSAVPLSFQTKHLRAILTRRSAEFLRTFSSSEVNGCGFCGRQVCYTHTRHPTLNTSVSLKARKRRWMLWGQSRAFHHMFLCSQVQQKRRIL